MRLLFSTWQASTPPWRKPAQIIRGVMKLPYTVGLEHLSWSIRGTEAFWSEGETFPADRDALFDFQKRVLDHRQRGGFLTIFL